MGSDSILAGIGATVLAVTLLVCGFAACCLPVTTASLAGAVSTGADSPYTHEQLVELAQETRAFTVDAHSSMEEARESLAADVVAAAREASAEGAPKYSQWTQKAKQVLGDVEGEGGTAVATMDALAKVSDRYALDAAACGSESCEVVLGDSGISSVLEPAGLEHCLFEDYFSPDTLSICFFQNDRAEIIDRLCTAFFQRCGRIFGSMCIVLGSHLCQGNGCRPHNRVITISIVGGIIHEIRI